MIPAIPLQNQQMPPPGSWKAAQASAVSDPAELLALLELDMALLPAARKAAALFGLRVPRGFVARMRKGDPQDPLLRQVLPLGDELETVAGFSHDPLGESNARLASGLLQKYAGRVLLTVTGACGVHCRYCFRRHFPYAEENPRRDWPQVLERIADDPEIHEVILSGGDPLLLDTPRLADITRSLESLPQLRRLRIHTRQPIVLPERVDADLLGWLSDIRLPVTIVVHVNHAHEIDADVQAALKRLRGTGTILLNQSVLLRGINDNVDTLARLSERLFESGVLPYYLHLLDPVAGAAHFDISEVEARKLMQQLHARLSGYLLPRLVREIPEKPGKSLINL